MTVTAGTLSQVSVSDTTASLLATAATAGTGPYTYQWYRSTTSGFSPGGGNIVSGATSLTLNDTGLIPNTQYYYKVVVTDTGHSNDTATYTQLAVATTAQTLNPNQFAQSEYLGTVDQPYSYATFAAQVDVSQATALYAGQAVKVYDSADGVPKVVAVNAASNDVFGFINYNMKNVTFAGGTPCEVSTSGNVIYLYATEAIARMARVCLDLSTVGGVRTTGSATGGDRVVGRAYDKATAAGQLIRVLVDTPTTDVA